MKLSHVGQTYEIDHDLDHLDPETCRYEVLCSRICTLLYRSNPGNMPFVDNAEYATPTRQHELARTDQESICSEISRS